MRVYLFNAILTAGSEAIVAQKHNAVCGDLRCGTVRPASLYLPASRLSVSWRTAAHHWARRGHATPPAPCDRRVSTDAPLLRELYPGDGTVLVRIARQQFVVTPPPALRVCHQAFLVLDAVG